MHPEQIQKLEICADLFGSLPEGCTSIEYRPALSGDVALINNKWVMVQFNRETSYPVAILGRNQTKSL